jgi:hypothetical protein
MCLGLGTVGTQCAPRICNRLVSSAGGLVYGQRPRSYLTKKKRERYEEKKKKKELETFERQDIEMKRENRPGDHGRDGTRTV